MKLIDKERVIMTNNKNNRKKRWQIVPAHEWATAVTKTTADLCFAFIAGAEHTGCDHLCFVKNKRLA